MKWFTKIIKEDPEKYREQLDQICPNSKFENIDDLVTQLIGLVKNLQAEAVKGVEQLNKSIKDYERTNSLYMEYFHRCGELENKLHTVAKKLDAIHEAGLETVEGVEKFKKDQKTLETNLGEIEEIKKQLTKQKEEIALAEKKVRLLWELSKVPFDYDTIDKKVDDIIQTKLFPIVTNKTVFPTKEDNIHYSNVYYYDHLLLEFVEIPYDKINHGYYSRFQKYSKDPNGKFVKI